MKAGIPRAHYGERRKGCVIISDYLEDDVPTEEEFPGLISYVSGWDEGRRRISDYPHTPFDISRLKHRLSITGLHYMPLPLCQLRIHFHLHINFYYEDEVS